jgi:AcrR family transcriptional regulator
MGVVEPGEDGVRKTTRGARTRERILDVAADLVSREPSATVGLERIARAAGVAKSSVLWHFGNKEQLYLEVADRWFADFQRSITAEIGEGRDLRQALPLLLRGYSAFLEARPEANVVLFTLLFGAPRGGELHRRIAAMYRTFRRGIVEATHVDGQPVPDADAALIVAVLDGIFVQSFIDPEGFDPDGAFARLEQLLPAWDGGAEEAP